MPSPTSERSVWTPLPPNVVTIDMNPICFGRGCFNAATQRRDDAQHRGIGYYCDACAEKAKAKEAAGG